MDDIPDKSSIRRLRAQLAGNPDALSMLERVVRVGAQLAHWKSNHADLALRAGLLSQRPDLPVDRLPAFRAMAQLQERVARFEQAATEFEARAERLRGVHDELLTMRHGYRLASDNCVRLEGLLAAAQEENSALRRDLAAQEAGTAAVEIAALQRLAEGLAAGGVRLNVIEDASVPRDAIVIDGVGTLRLTPADLAALAASVR